MRSLSWFDRPATLVLPQLGGVWLMEAVKKVPAPSSSKMALRYRSAAVIRPALSPHSTPIKPSKA